jgi:hypothetical protein
MTEESLKLVPLLVLAAVAPGRVRRFASVDWLLLALASGLGFQAWEEVMRRLSLAVSKPGLLDLSSLFSADRTGPGSGWPQYGWGLLSGGSGYWSGDDVWAYPGHHVETALVGASAGLGIAVWRWSRASVAPGARLRRRALALLVPAGAFYVVIVDHVGNNAAQYDRRWADGADASAPWVIREGWSVLGQGAGRGRLLLVVLVICLLLDGAILHGAGSVTDLPAARLGDGEGAEAWWCRPNAAVDRLAGAWGFGREGPLRSGLVAGLGLGLHAARDLALMLGAHLREPGESRREAMDRGRAAVELSLQVRREAMSAVLEPPVADLAGELVARRRFRMVTGLVLALVVLTGTVGAALVARRIGTDFTPGGGPISWLAGQFDSLATWWASRSVGQKVLLGVGVAALVALSGGSLGLAFGVSGAATYLAEHGHGTADFLRNPAAATRSYLATTTPAAAGLDLAEFGLTFAPGNFAGALGGQGARNVVRDYLDTRAVVRPQRLDEIKSWLHEINPGYDGFGPRAVNCGRCAVAVAERIQGRHAVAGIGTHSVEEMEAITGVEQVPMSPSQIEAALRAKGPGSVAVVGIDRQATQGHWFNAYFDGDKVVAIDGQSGHILDWPPDYSFPGHPVTNWDAGVL